MGENLNELTCPVILPNDNIRLVQINLQSQLQSFQKKEPSASLLGTYSICESVKEKVLNSEDEPHLSKTQNNCRRISIASELFINICFTYDYIVDYEFSRIINELVQWKKYKHLTTKITHKMHLESKKEKYFVNKAQSKLKINYENAVSKTSDAANAVTPKQATFEPETELIQVHEKSICPREQEQINHRESPKDQEQRIRTDEAVTREVHADETLKTLLEDLDEDNNPNVNGNITELRSDSVLGTSALQISNLQLQREIHSFPSAVPEISIHESNFQLHGEDDFNQILKILEEEAVEKDISEVKKSKTETNDKIGEPDGIIMNEETPTLENELNQLEDVEEWTLPTLEPIEEPQRKQPLLIVDKTTIIHNYSRRALYLNDNIKVQRVQVFEGPPRVLRAMSAKHLMETPSFKSSFFQDFRSSKLNKLFERHLKVEKKPVEPRVVPQRIIEQAQEIDAFQLRANNESLKDVGVRAGMHSSVGRAAVLVETAKEKSFLKDIDTSAALPGKESLIGVPLSRIVGSALEDPDMKTISNVPYFPTLNAPNIQSERVQELREQGFVPETHASWFFSTEKNPPSAKYKEYDYIYKKIKDYWYLSEIQGTEKSITLKEFFRFETDGGISNFLTALRIVDKLSIQRKLILEYKNLDIVIRPFEIPYVSEKLVVRKDKESQTFK